MSLGLTRTARSELSVKLFTVEIDDKTNHLAASKCLVDILMRRHSPQLDAESMDPDWEYAVVDGQILVPRMHWQTMAAAFERTNGDDSCPTEKHLSVKTPGLLHTMGWSQSERAPLEHGQVTVQTRAIGLNFRVRAPHAGDIEGMLTGIGCSHRAWCSGQ